jgi:D-alanyl-D-alanine carboxypeptidase (penicillin-binding protein 5/6)
MADTPRGAFPAQTRSELRLARRLEHPGRGRRGADRSRRLLVVVAVAFVVVVAAVVVVGFRRAAVRPPVVLVRATLASDRVMPAGDPSLPWPPGAQAAVAIPALGYATQSGPEHAVPVASMTKVVTAYVILHDHPLRPGQSGPKITITAADAADYGTDVVSDQSSIDITAGEVLTESQMLAGMLVHSANDFAYALAVWDAGSLPAFVAKMNATAAALGMTQSHFVDASGFTPQSVSTPADLLKVASINMENPVFAKDVSMPDITLPVAGTISSYTPLLPGGTTGVPGVVGVKSGYTTHAGGGDILAWQASAGGQPFVVLAAVSSLQGPDVLDTAGHLDLTLAQAAAAQVRLVPVVAPGQQVATASIPGAASPVVTTASGSLLTWPGQHVTQAVVVTRHLRAGAPAGSEVGMALFTLGRQQLAVPLRTVAKLPAPTLGQRLF